MTVQFKPTHRKESSHQLLIMEFFLRVTLINQIALAKMLEITLTKKEKIEGGDHMKAFNFSCEKCGNSYWVNHVNRGCPHCKYILSGKIESQAKSLIRIIEELVGSTSSRELNEIEIKSKLVKYEKQNKIEYLAEDAHYYSVDIDRKFKLYREIDTGRVIGFAFYLSEGDDVI